MWKILPLDSTHFGGTFLFSNCWLFYNARISYLQVKISSLFKKSIVFCDLSEPNQRMRYFFVLISVLFSATAFGQDLLLCGSPQKEKEAREKNPSIYIEEARLKQFVHDWIAANSDNLRDNAEYIIPVVFHIIHDYGYENISDDQVRDAVRILNEDYRKLNADTSTIVTSFKSIAADAQIEFRLANKTSGGQCTNGINHIHSLATYAGGDNAKLDDWPRNMYLNVWTVRQFGADLAGVAGYAYLPYTANYPSNAPYDGVIILSSYVGSIGTGNYSTGRALTHEVGHTLGLSHPWGDTNSPGEYCGDDGVDDTPETEGWSSCNLNGSICHPPVIENVQNYMDYSYCSRMFTTGQRDVLQGTLNYSTAARNNLWTTTNLAATGTSDTLEPLCAPQADFYSNYKLACTGTSITFHDVSWSGTEDSRTWTFQDGNPATSADSDPAVTFSSPGWKTVTLVATNTMGSGTAVRNNYIFISDNSTALYHPAYGEHFENAATFTNDWMVLNPEGNNSTWKRVTNAGNCVELNNYHNMSGDIDALITPPFDLTSGGAIYFNFRYTCASNANDDAGIDDGLYIYSSTNCGQTWFLRASIKGIALANAGDYSNGYIPAGNSPWVAKSILLNPSLYQPNVRFKFEYKTNGQGNNIYIDDVEIQNNPVGVNDPDAASFALNVFPNPLTENSVAAIYQHLAGNLNLRIVDITGRTLKVLNSGWLSEGEHHFDLKVSDLSNAGMYFLVADDGVMISRVKIVVQ